MRSFQKGDRVKVLVDLSREWRKDQIKVDYVDRDGWVVITDGYIRGSFMPSELKLVDEPKTELKVGDTVQTTAPVPGKSIPIGTVGTIDYLYGGDVVSVYVASTAKRYYCYLSRLKLVENSEMKALDLSKIPLNQYGHIQVGDRPAKVVAIIKIKNGFGAILIIKEVSGVETTSNRNLDGTGFWSVPPVTLVKKKIKVDFYINIYRDGEAATTFDSKEEANRAAASDRIACLHVCQEVEQGEGLPPL